MDKQLALKQAIYAACSGRYDVSPAWQIANACRIDKDLFSAPFAPYAGWPRFLIRRGRIPQRTELRRGGIWQIVRTNRWNTSIYVTCPIRDCKAIIHLNGLIIDELGDIGYHNDSCAVCTSCDIHMWFILTGWDKRHSLPIAER